MTLNQTVLPNGMTVVTDYMESVETVSLGAWVQVGGRFETAEINGVSHMLEHMAFKGTQRRSALDIALEFENVGGQLNAYTSSEVTAYHATILKEDVALAVDIIADILQHSVFDEDELERERMVILQEIGHAQDSPEDQVFEAFQMTAFPDQPVGRPILGPAANVSAMQRTTLVEYMRTHYTAPRVIFAAAGKLDHDALVRSVEEQFGSLTSEGEAAPEPALYQGGAARLERPIEQAHLTLGFEGCSYRDPDRYAMGVASMILGGGMSSRLFQRIRETLGLVYSIYCFTSPYSDTGLFGVYAGTGEDGLAQLVPEICNELLRATDGFEEQELLRAKAQLRSGAVMALESTQTRAERIARDTAIHGHPVAMADVLQEIEALTASDIQAAIRRVLTSKPTVSAVGPVGKLSAFEDIEGSLKPAA